MPVESALSRQEIIRVLSKTMPFSFLGDEPVARIASMARVAHYPAGSFIFREGERSKRTLFLVLEGQARAVAGFGGEEAVTTVRKRGDFFGVTVLLSDEPYPLSMLASEELTCLLIAEDAFQEALTDNSRFADYFTKALATRLKELYRTFSDSNYEKQLVHGQTLRRRVSDLAEKRVITALPMDSIRDVAKKMSAENVSSVVIKAFNDMPVGIITEKDLVKKVLTMETPDLDRRAHEIMSKQLIKVKPEDFTYKALLMMIKHNINHVVVTDEHDVLHGIVTIKDLIRTRNSGALSIVRRIEYQEDYAGVAELIGEVDQVQHALLTERSYASEICALISELYDRITRKVIELAEEEMVREGLGSPPVPYSFINMGSAGRGEQFARTDQDNGIIFADPRPAPRVHGKATGHDRATEDLAAAYFLTLGAKIVRGLEICGFKRCSGLVMADNPRWCRPLAAWKKSIQTWVDKLDPRDIRDMTIFLDYRHIAGDADLHENLKIFTVKLFQEAKHAQLFLAEDDLKHKVPLNLFRQIITAKTGKKRKKLNLKSTVMVHVVDAIRLFALREGIRETNTFERIHRLKERGIFKTEDAEYFEAAYETLLMFRIRATLEKLRHGEEADNYIEPETLSKKDKNLLKESLLIVGKLQSLTAHTFHAHHA